MPDTFSFEVIFSGLCCFVPNKDWGASPDKVCVLLPDAARVNEAEKVPLALDNEELRRHRGIVRIPVHHLASIKHLADGTDFTLESETVMYLNHQRLQFGFTFSKPQKGLVVDYNPKLDAQDNAKLQSDLQRGDLTWLPDMNRITEEVLSGGARLDDHYFEISPKTDGPLLAQILIQFGELSADVTDMAWKFDPTLNGRRYRRPLTQSIKWRVEGLTELRMIRENFSSLEPVKPLELTPNGPNTLVRIHIHNIDDLNPLSWDLPSPPEAKDDTDFRWHYEILSEPDKEKIKEKLKCEKAGLPIPIPDPGRGGSSLGNNCIPTRFGAHYLGKLPYLKSLVPIENSLEV